MRESGEKTARNRGFFDLPRREPGRVQAVHAGKHAEAAQAHWGKGGAGGARPRSDEVERLGGIATRAEL